MRSEHYLACITTITGWLLQLTISSLVVFSGWQTPAMAQVANFHPCNAQPALPICRHGYGKKIAVRRWNAQPDPLDKDAVIKAPLTTTDPAIDIKNLKASSILVQDIDNGEILFERDASATRSIASITKLMTALVILDAHLDMAEEITITASDHNLASEIPARLASGTKWNRNDLLRMALTASENSAAHALGRSYPGGMEAFVAAMNNKARAIGMTDSHFAEPTGLSNDNVATANDLAKLIHQAAKYPLITEYTSSAKQDLNGYIFKNTNMLVGRPLWDIQLSKTGTTREAGDCLVMLAGLEGRNIAIVLLNASGGNGTRFGDAVRVRRIVHNQLVASQETEVH